MGVGMMDKARDFLARGRIAIVGVSRNEKDFSRMVFRELRRRGYDVVPVNPGLTELEGRSCFGRLQDVRPPVEGALLLTPQAKTRQVVRDCLDAGIGRVWMHRGAGAGTASRSAIAFCEENGIEVVADLCPFMALPGAGLPHRIHGFFRRRSLSRRQARVMPCAAPARGRPACGASRPGGGSAPQSRDRPVPPGADRPGPGAS